MEAINKQYFITKNQRIYIQYKIEISCCKGNPLSQQTQVMSKSPIKDYTVVLEQSRTKKKQDTRLLPETKQYDRYSSYVPRKHSALDFDDTRMKLQLTLKHNARLLDENATLSEMANSLRSQVKNCHADIQMLKRQHEQFLKASAKQRQALLMQSQLQSSNHQEQLRKLLDEISTLHEQKNAIQIQHAKEVQKMKSEFEKSLLSQMQGLKNMGNNVKELYEVQVSGLKEQLKKQQYEMENVKALERLQKNRLKDQISSVENQMKHLKQKYDIELQQLMREYERDKVAQKHRSHQQKQIEASEFNSKLKKLRKQLLGKAQDLQSVNKRMYHQQQSYNFQSIAYRKDKQNLLAELTNNEINYQTTLMREKNKLQELGKLEVDNLTQLFQTNVEQLQGEVNRMRLLVDCKTEEIKQAYEENRKLKESYGQEVVWYQGENKMLKERLRDTQLQHRQQQETLKVKLAQLIDTNTKQLSTYFHKQLSSLSIHNRQLSLLNKDLKDRIYKLIQQNDEIRKAFEIDISKYKARVQDYKIKLAAMSLQHKEHVGSLASKVQMTSQTLIRQGETKERTKSFYQQQRRKFHALVNQKDQHIAQLLTSLQSIKQMHENELQAIAHQRDQFKEEIQSLQQQRKSVKQRLEQELVLKQEKLRSLRHDNQQEIDEIKELEGRLAESEKDNIRLRKTVDHLNLVNQSIAQELGLKKGFIETLQLQSNAAIQEEKSKIRGIMGSHQVTLREYFEEQLKSKNQDIDALQRKVVEKEEDIRQLIIKFNALEKRFDMAMEAQDKIRQFEEKIRQLGLDNNLVKNMAELFQKKA